MPEEAIADYVLSEGQAMTFINTEKAVDGWEVLRPRRYVKQNGKIVREVLKPVVERVIEVGKAV